MSLYMKSRKAKDCKCYLLTVLDRFNQRLSAQEYDSFDEAHDVGESLEKDLSFIISRVLFNSKYPDKGSKCNGNRKTI